MTSTNQSPAGSKVVMAPGKPHLKKTAKSSRQRPRRTSTRCEKKASRQDVDDKFADYEQIARDGTLLLAVERSYTSKSWGVPAGMDRCSCYKLAEAETLVNEKTARKLRYDILDLCKAVLDGDQKKKRTPQECRWDNQLIETSDRI